MQGRGRRPSFRAQRPRPAWKERESLAREADEQAQYAEQVMGPLLGFPKPRPAALDRADKRKADDAEDRSENAKVRARSGGLCEVRGEPQHRIARRCTRPASEIHHLIGGIGRRGVGKSAKAEWKLHTCAVCHALITRHVLVPSSQTHDATAVTFWKRR